MTTDELLNIHNELCGKAKAIMSKKSVDYSGGTVDALSNFKASELFGVPPELGLLIRMTDKMKRITSFVKTGKLLVEDENIEDTIVDLINYPVLLMGLIREKQESLPLMRNNIIIGGISYEESKRD